MIKKDIKGSVTYLQKLSRFFRRKRAKYILLVINDGRKEKEVLTTTPLELNKENKKILPLFLKDDDVSVYRQVKNFIAAQTDSIDGLIVCNLNLLIFKYPGQCLSLLNKARDAFSNFELPIVFVVNSNNLGKIINEASDFYQLRDLPDYHIESGEIASRETLPDLSSTNEPIPDSALKEKLLENQLKRLGKGKRISKSDLDSIILPLLRLYIDRNELNKMRKLFQDYVEGKEDQVADNLTLGRYYSKTSDINRAIECFEKVLLVAPDDVNTLSSYALVLTAKGDFDRAFECLEKALLVAPCNVNTLRSYALAMTEHGNFERAIDFFEKVLLLSPHDVITLRSYANVLTAKGDFDRAIDFFEKALLVAPHDVLTLRSYANAMTAKGDFDRAVECFEKALSVAPRDVNTLLSYANAMTAKGDFDRAIDFFEKALLVAPDGVITFRSYAITLKEKGDYNKAFEYFEKSLAVDTDEKQKATTLQAYATALKVKGEYDRAIEKFVKALEIDKKKGNNTGLFVSFQQLGSIHKELGKYTEALRYYLQAYLIVSKTRIPGADEVVDGIHMLRGKIPPDQFTTILNEFNLSPEEFEKKRG